MRIGADDDSKVQVEAGKIAASAVLGTGRPVVRLPLSDEGAYAEPARSIEVHA